MFHELLPIQWLKDNLTGCRLRADPRQTAAYVGDVTWLNKLAILYVSHPAPDTAVTLTRRA